MWLNLCWCCQVSRPLTTFCVHRTNHLSQPTYPAKTFATFKTWRYRVELCILDGTESAVFVVFYAKISWLTNVRAAEISELMVCLSGHILSPRLYLSRNMPWQTFSFCRVLAWETVGAEVPQFLQNIVGRTFTFQLELTKLASDLHCYTYLWPHQRPLTATFAIHVNHILKFILLLTYMKRCTS